MAIQDIIKKRRLELGLTLKDVADSLGVAESSVSRYETSDIANMKIDKLIPLAKVLKCTPADLMKEEDGFDYKWLQLFASPEPEQSKETKQLLEDFSKLTRDQQLTVLALIHSMTPNKEN